MRKRMKESATTLECRYLTEDSQVKIYLIPTAPVRKRQRSILKIKLRLLRAADAIFRWLVIASITLLLSIFLLEAVYADKGYFAVGSKYLFIGLIILGVHSGINRIFDRGIKHEDISKTHSSHRRGKNVRE